MNNEMNVPIEVTHLFPVLGEKLLELLRSLTAEEWHRPTIAKLWQVKDIAAHLLDGNLRTLSSSRDKYLTNVDVSINNYQDLVEYLNALNADWVKAMRRVSPQLLIEFLAITGKEFSSLMSQADLFTPAVYAVSWAGETESVNWFHIAREYTEKWIHQQQIRNAVGREGIMTKELFSPLMNTLMRGLPYTYRNTDATQDTVVRVTITTDIGDDWYLHKTGEGWILSKEALQAPSAELYIDPDTAWKLFTKGITPLQCSNLVKIKGDDKLAGTALTMISVMA